MTEKVGVLVIGAGQAGLAASYRLTRAGASHIVVDAAARIGDSWRQRYDSLTLFTPRSLSSLPSLALSGDPNGYATRDEFAEYLETYARQFCLPVTTGARVVRLIEQVDGLFEARLDSGATLKIRAAVVCTGAFQQPVVPNLSAFFSPEVKQFTSASYANPAGVPSGRVLVVGDGASGRDIAVDLANTHQVLLASGKRRRLFPERFFRQSTWIWMDRLGLLSTTPNSTIGRVMKAADPFPDRGRSLPVLAGLGVDVRCRLLQAEGRQAQFADNTTAEIDAVIWAIGYRDEWDWLEVSPGTPGVYFLGRPWQRNRASGLILGALRDSEPVIKKVVADLR
jgi:putative flavoprotein involved in K+ transport